MSWIQEYWTQIVFLCGMLGGLWKWGATLIEKITLQSKNTNSALLEIIRYRFYKECDKCIDVKCKSIKQLEMLEHLYSSYKSLGGNGTGDILYEEAMNQPTVDNDIFEQFVKEVNCKDYKKNMCVRGSGIL